MGDGGLNLNEGISQSETKLWSYSATLCHITINLICQSTNCISSPIQVLDIFIMSYGTRSKSGPTEKKLTNETNMVRLCELSD